MLVVDAKVDLNLLPSMADKLEGAVNRAVREEAMAVWGDLILNIRKYDAIDTGTMWRSIYARSVDRYTWEVVSPMFYSGYVNYGTYKMAARPFFTEAVERSSTRFVARIEGLFG